MTTEPTTREYDVYVCRLCGAEITEGPRSDLPVCGRKLINNNPVSTHCLHRWLTIDDRPPADVLVRRYRTTTELLSERAMGGE